MIMVESVKVKVKATPWKETIRKTIYEQNEAFCVYDIVKKILADKMNDRRELNRWVARVKSVIAEMKESNEIELVGWREGNAPVNKKLYKLKVKKQ